MWAISLYILIIFSLLQNWVIMAFGFILVFSFWYNSLTLIPLAMLIDGYFGNFHTLPILSLMAVVWYVFVEYLRPKLANFRTQ